MRRAFMGLTMAALFTAMSLAQPSAAEPNSDQPKHGGILRIYHRDSPASASILEEATVSTNAPFMGVFNNLVLFDQHVAQNSFDSIRPELATSWALSDDQTKLTFKLRSGVKWHDGKPFTAKDVKCTFDMLMDRSSQKLRKNPRQSWYANVKEVSVNGDDEVSFQLGRPQPSLIALLASGYAPIYPCHVSPRDMRVAPIGTGPFRFVEFKANESIKVTRNPDYWKPGLPHLDGVEYTIIPNRSTAILSFVAGKFDLTFPYEVSIPLLKDVKNQMPEAICEITTTNVAPNILMNQAPPFDNVEMRRAVIMAIDRKAFIDILTEGQATMGGAMMPPPEGRWGLPEEVLRTLPGFDPDIAKSREAARAIMRAHGYGPDNHLKIKLSARNLAVYRDPSVILLGQLKEIWIDGELELIETANWVPKLIRRDYQMGLSLVGNGVDDPDQQFYESYVCGSRTYMGYCNKEIDALVDRQSAEADQEKRRQIVWEIDRRLQQDAVRPILYYIKAATCRRPEVKGLTLMLNSTFNGWRMEDVWLDR